jgi:hypothetical protein
MSTLNVGTVKTDTIKTSADVEVYTCKAWVNFNGTGTVAIRASGNVSSITDNGPGDYTINFTNAIVDASYSATFSSNANVIRASAAGTAFQNTAFRVQTLTLTPALTDTAEICVSIFR